MKAVRHDQAVADEDGLNFAQENKEEESEAGVQMLINSVYEESECFDEQEGSSRRRNRNRKKKSKPAESAGVPISATRNEEIKQERSGEVKRLICVHCGSTMHNLDTCPEVTVEQLAEILVQLDDLALEGGEDQGAMIFQKQRDSAVSKPSIGGLRSNRLYLDTCTTNDQITNPAYLTGIYTETTSAH